MSNASATHILVEEAFGGGETQKHGNLCKMSVDKTFWLQQGLQNCVTLSQFICFGVPLPSASVLQNCQSAEKKMYRPTKQFVSIRLEIGIIINSG